MLGVIGDGVKTPLFGCEQNNIIINLPFCGVKGYITLQGMETECLFEAIQRIIG